MIFPRGKPVLENAKLTFVDFDSILHASKRERASKISGYVAVHYPDHSELLFLKKGEPINAAWFSPTQKRVIPIGEVTERAKTAFGGSVSIYEVEEELISMMLTTLTSTPIHQQRLGGSEDLSQFLAWLKKKKPTGFVEISTSEEVSYVVVQSGKTLRGYTASRQSRELGPESFTALISRDGAAVGVYQGTTQEIEQASPALMMLFVKMTNRLIEEFMEAVGPTLVHKFLDSSKKEAEKDFPLVKEFTIGEDVRISGHSLATPDELTRSFAKWVKVFLDSFDSFLGPRHEEIVRKGIKDYRFAVKSTGFFDYFGLGRYFE